jgi:hypothetical protein
MYQSAVLALVAALFGVGTASHAAIVTWNLNATFDDGGTATGFFAFDFDEEFIPVLSASRWDIKMTPGTSIASALSMLLRWQTLLRR